MNKSILRLLAREDKARKAVAAAREICPHFPRFVRYEHCGDTGNWCSGDDSYWTRYYCMNCGKLWREEGSTSIHGAFRVNYTREALIPKGL